MDVEVNLLIAIFFVPTLSLMPKLLCKILLSLIKFLDNYKIDLIIDIGSHKGEFLSNVIKCIPFKKAYTFEPQKEVFEILKNNLINDNRILHNNLGISDKVGEKKDYN